MALSYVPNKDEKSSGRINEKSSAPYGISIATDEPITDAPDFDNYSRAISNIITNSVPRFTVGIYGGWGTGKTTIMQMIQFFDAWRYENEELSALVPLVRTIILHLEDYVEKLQIENSQKKLRLRIWQTNL